MSMMIAVAVGANTGSKKIVLSAHLIRRLEHMRVIERIEVAQVRLKADRVLVLRCWVGRCSSNGILAGSCHLSSVFIGYLVSISCFAALYLHA